MINRTYSLNDVRFLMFIALIDGIILGVLLSGNLAHSQTRITPAEVCKGKTAREQCVCLGMDYDPHLKPVPGCAVKKLPEPKFEIVPFSHTEDGWNIEEYVAPAIRSQDVPAVQKEVRGLTSTIIPCGGPPVDNPLFACSKPDMVLQWVCEDSRSVMMQAQDGKYWCHLPIEESATASIGTLGISSNVVSSGNLSSSTLSTFSSRVKVFNPHAINDLIASCVVNHGKLGTCHYIGRHNLRDVIQAWMDSH